MPETGTIIPDNKMAAALTILEDIQAFKQKQKAVSELRDMLEFAGAAPIDILKAQVAALIGKAPEVDIPPAATPKTESKTKIEPKEGGFRLWQGTVLRKRQTPQYEIGPGWEQI
jgi:hypothetical protein